MYQRAYMPNKAQGVILGENRVTGITPKTDIYSNKKVGSSNQNETRKKHRPRDMPPLDPMQKKSRVSVKIVGLGYFSTNLGFVLVTGAKSSCNQRASR